MYDHIDSNKADLNQTSNSIEYQKQQKNSMLIQYKPKKFAVRRLSPADP